MKNILILSALVLSNCTFAQLAIGKQTLSNTAVSLEFGNYVAGQGKGLIVPYVTAQNNVTNAELGTVIFDSSDRIMKYRKSDGTWFHLSKNETVTVGGQQNFDTTGIVNTSIQNPLVDKPNAKVSMGYPTNTPGILVLEDNNKAMILPKVPSPHLNVINPEPGLMVYDTDSKMLAVFNGKVWSFWKN